MAQIRRLLPSLNALVAFEAAVRCGTFARAAQEMGVTSPAVSRTIGRLESHLGVLLFKRKATGVELTRDGNDLFSVISRSLGEIERTLEDLLGRARPCRRPIVLSVSAAFAAHWFMPRLARFQERFPGEEIQFQLVNGQLDGALEGVDIAMRFDPVPDERTIVHPLMQELLLPVCAPQYKGKRSDADLLLPNAMRMITLSGSHIHWADLFAMHDDHAYGSQIVLTDYNLVIQAALVGQGIAVGWLNVVSSLLSEGALIPAHPKIISTGRRCDLVTPRTPRSEVIGEVCEWISSQYKNDMMNISSRNQGIKNIMDLMS